MHCAQGCEAWNALCANNTAVAQCSSPGPVPGAPSSSLSKEGIESLCNTHCMVRQRQQDGRWVEKACELPRCNGVSPAGWIPHTRWSCCALLRRHPRPAAPCRHANPTCAYRRAAATGRPAKTPPMPARKVTCAIQINVSAGRLRRLRGREGLQHLHRSAAHPGAHVLRWAGCIRLRWFSWLFRWAAGCIAQGGALRVWRQPAGSAPGSLLLILPTCAAAVQALLADPACLAACLCAAAMSGMPECLTPPTGTGINDMCANEEVRFWCLGRAGLGWEGVGWTGVGRAGLVNGPLSSVLTLAAATGLCICVDEERLIMRAQPFCSAGQGQLPAGVRQPAQPDREVPLSVAGKSPWSRACGIGSLPATQAPLQLTGRDVRNANLGRRNPVRTQAVCNDEPPCQTEHAAEIGTERRRQAAAGRADDAVAARPGLEPGRPLRCSITYIASQRHIKGAAMSWTALNRQLRELLPRFALPSDSEAAAELADMALHIAKEGAELSRLQASGFAPSEEEKEALRG